MYLQIHYEKTSKSLQIGEVDVDLTKRQSQP
jgi:hypothetical protein